MPTTHSQRAWPRRAAASAAVALGAVLLAAPAPASAHVRVHADSSTTGSFSALTFRVPNESDTAATTKITVELPQQTPFLYVSTRPVPGWRAVTTTATLPKPVDSEGTTITKAVRTITWTAESGADAIGRGQYQEFSASVGPLPAPGTIILPATQTYSDGSVVRWDQPTTDGAEPEHPAPALVITAAAASPTAVAPSSAAPGTNSTTGTAAVGTDVTARVLGGAGLVIGIAGLVLGALGLRARRSS